MALSVTVSVAVSAAATDGVKIILTVQDFVAANDGLQVVADCTKSAPLVPLIVIDDKLTATAVLFFSVTALAALVLASPWFPNVRVAGVAA